jgi:hypothetical protein
MPSDRTLPQASWLSLGVRLFVGLAAALSGVMLWLWASLEEQRWKYAPAVFCFCLAVAMCLPAPTGRLREVLSRSVGVVLMLIAAAAAVGLVLFIGSAAGDFEWKHNGGFIACVSLAALGWSLLFPSYYAPILVDHDDPVMKASMEQARRELVRLRRGIDEGRKQAFIKFPLKSAEGETEHIWGMVHLLTGEMAQVSLANEPVHGHAELDPRFPMPLADLSPRPTSAAGAGRLSASLLRRTNGPRVPRNSPW